MPKVVGDAANSKVPWQGWLLLASLPSLSTCNGTEMTSAVSEGTRSLFEKTDHDFGRVSPGGIFRCSFVFENSFSSPLRIEGVKTTCGCVAQVNSTELVSPGGSGAIQVELKTVGLRAPQKLKKGISITFSQEARRWESQLSVSAELRGDVTIQPDEVKFSEGDAEGWYRSAIRIGRDMLPWEAFLKLEVVGDEEYYAIDERVRSGDAVEVNVRFSPADAPSIPKPLEVQYEKDGRTKAIYLPVVHPNTGRGVELIPRCYLASVKWGASQMDLRELTGQTVRLAAAGDGDVAITKIEIKREDDAGVFGWEMRANDKEQFELRVRRLPNAKQLSCATLNVFYHDRVRDRDGKVTLDAYLVCRSREDGRGGAANLGRLLQEPGG